MRRVVVLALLALALPIAALADPISIVNETGTLAISAMAGTNGLGTIGATTITSNQSQLRQWDLTTGYLGTVNFSTGTLASGSILNGGTFNGGGSFDIIGQGAWAKALTGMNGKVPLFTGSFSGPITWAYDYSSGAEKYYTLSGSITGSLWDGRSMNGFTSQIILIENKTQANAGTGHVTIGTTLLTPEPGTLGLLGTGLVGVAGMFRRKLIKG